MSKKVVNQDLKCKLVEIMLGKHELEHRLLEARNRKIKEVV